MSHCLDKSSKHGGSALTKIIFPIDLLASQRASAHLLSSDVGLVCVTVNSSVWEQISESYGIQVSLWPPHAGSLKSGRLLCSQRENIAAAFESRPSRSMALFLLTLQGSTQA